MLVVDDQQLMREDLLSLLSIQEQIDVIGMAQDGEDAIKQAQPQPDVILMDMRMPIMGGVIATAQARKQLPRCQVLMLTTFDDEEYVVKVLIAGKLVGTLHGSEPRSASPQFGSEQSKPEQSGPKTSEPNNLASDTGLTEREIEVLRLIATGDTNREIAERLVTTKGTVKNHVSNVLGRLEMRERTQAAIYAHELNLV